MTAYQAIRAEADRLGWPEHFRGDLDWDEKAISSMEPGDAFMWSIYDWGTHLFYPDWIDGADHRSWDMMPVLERCFPRSRYYWWDGVALHYLKSGSVRAAELLREAHRRKKVD